MKSGVMGLFFGVLIANTLSKIAVVVAFLVGIAVGHYLR